MSLSLNAAAVVTFQKSHKSHWRQYNAGADGIFMGLARILCEACGEKHINTVQYVLAFWLNELQCLCEFFYFFLDFLLLPITQKVIRTSSQCQRNVHKYHPNDVA